MARNKDLFDDSTMSFGEHLEELRTHLIRALIGLVICVVFSLFFGNAIINIVRSPIDSALREYGALDTAEDDLGDFDFRQAVKDWWNGVEPEVVVEAEPVEVDPQLIRISISAEQLLSQLRQAGADELPELEDDATVQLDIRAPEFAQLRKMKEQMNKPVTLNVQEAFLTYLKVAFVGGFVLASPWVFYQMWLFVASGLYKHERKYVYIYLPLSLTLFLTGAVFCFYMVFPFVLHFLLGFNKMMGVEPQIRLSEWISFAIMLPVMFGLSFQLPLVMLFLERITVFEVKAYRENRRMAVLVIAFLSMMLTPADPMSMLLMMFPLIALYEMGIWLCGLTQTQKSPFEEAAA